MTERTASAVWDGGLEDGRGRVSLDSSGLGTFDVSWPRRAGDPEGVTSPEELLAAAHAACFCMAFSKEVTDGGGSNAHFDVTATATFVPGTGITNIALKARGKVNGLGEEEFVAAAERAKDGCPVSGLFKGGSADITLDAAVA